MGTFLKRCNWAIKNGSTQNFEVFIPTPLDQGIVADALTTMFDNVSQSKASANHFNGPYVNKVLIRQWLFIMFDFGKFKVTTRTPKFFCLKSEE